jgi:hypothetical protein
MATAVTAGAIVVFGFAGTAVAEIREPPDEDPPGENVIASNYVSVIDPVDDSGS